MPSCRSRSTAWWFSWSWNFQPPGLRRGPPRRLVACGSGGASCGRNWMWRRSISKYIRKIIFKKNLWYHDLRFVRVPKIGSVPQKQHSFIEPVYACMTFLSFQAESIRYPEMRPAGYAFQVILKGLQLQLQRYEQHGKPHWISGAYICIYHCMYIYIVYPFVSFSYLKIIKVSNHYDGNDSIWPGNTLPEVYSREI